MTDEEREKMYSKRFEVDGQPRYLHQLVSRRKKKRTFEYEVSWKGLSSLSFNRW